MTYVLSQNLEENYEVYAPEIGLDIISNAIIVQKLSMVRNKIIIFGIYIPKFGVRLILSFKYYHFLKDFG